MAINDALQALNFNNDFNDSSGNNNNASTTNVTIDTSIKKIGAGSAEFSNDADVITLGQPYSSGSDNFSVAFWIYFDTTPQNNDFIWSSNKTLSGANNKSQIYISTALGQPNIRVNIKGSTNRTLYSTTSPGTGTWYHVVLTRNGSNVKLYVQGSEEDSITNGDTNDVLDNFGVRPW